MLTMVKVLLLLLLLPVVVTKEGTKVGVPVVMTMTKFVFFGAGGDHSVSARKQCGAHGGCCICCRSECCL